MKKLMILLITFIVGFFTARIIIPGSQVYLRVINQSNLKVKSVIIQQAEKRISINNLAKNDNMLITLTLKGEGSYQMKVILENGKILESQGGYIESGYWIEETIKQDSIIQKINLWGNMPFLSLE